MSGEYEGVRWIQYGEGIYEGATFVPVCRKCARFVKADKAVRLKELGGVGDEPNATCSRCGRTQMLFVGYL